MRVFIWYWGRRGGGAQFTLRMARALAQREDIEVKLSLSAQVELLAAFSELKVPIHMVKTYTDRLGFLVSSLRIPYVASEFVKAAKGSDVVISGMTHLWTPLVCPSLASSGIPYVPVVHDAQPHPGDPALAWSWSLNRELKAARAAIVLSESVAQVLAKRVPHLPVIRMQLRALVDGNCLEAKNPRESKDICFLFFGRFRLYKGLDILRDAFSILLSKNLPVRLLVVGEGDAHACAPGLALLKGVTIENRWVADNEISSLLLNADAVVLPYREASQSGVVPQALMMGVPVIGTPVGGLIDQIREGHGGLLANEPSAHALAAVMEYACAPKILEELSEQARLAGRRFSNWDAAANELLSGLHRTL